MLLLFTNYYTIIIILLLWFIARVWNCWRLLCCRIVFSLISSSQSWAWNKLSTRGRSVLIMTLLQPIGILISNKVCVWMTLFLSAYFVYYIKVQLFLIKCNTLKSYAFSFKVKISSSILTLNARGLWDCQDYYYYLFIFLVAIGNVKCNMLALLSHFIFWESG